LPHHNLVQTIRQDFLKEIALKRPVTQKIILIGPDHFSPNQNQINISDQNWHLSTGNMLFENQSINLPVNNNLLKSDHAVYNPLADLKKYFPTATIYPIIIGQKVDQKTLDNLLAQIKSACHSDCLLVASVDFSHYLPATLAEVHDAFTINNLQNLDTQNILKSEVDSPQSLYILTKFSQFKKFNLFAHTNSGLISKNPDTETTTHVFGSYSFGFPQKSVVKTETIQNNDFSISTITTPTQTIKSFLPIKNNIFLRGLEKQQLIKNYFDSIQDVKSLTKDYFWGKLIYERK